MENFSLKFLKKFPENFHSENPEERCPPASDSDCSVSHANHTERYPSSSR